MWPTMNARFPQDDSPQSLEGTAAHWVASELYEGREHKENTLTPNGVVITGEMLDGAELVVDTVRTRTKGLMAVHVEEQVAIPSIHADCFGTPDFWAVHEQSLHLELIDYKYGHGFVDEYFNPQGILYMLGIHERFKAAHPPDISDITVSFTIVQPRCFYRGEPVRTHTYKLREIYEHTTRLKHSAIAAHAATPVATTNPECGHCPGRHACSALQKAAYSDAETATDRQPHDLTPEAASLELRMLERALSRLEARVEGLRELTLANLKAGKPIPHYRAEAGKGRTQWNVPPEQIVTIGKMLGKDLSKPGIITPAQAAKLGIDGSVIMAYSQQIPGSIKLVAENNADVRKVFGNPSGA